MKKMFFIISYVCIGYLILIISLFVFQRSFLYFPEKGKIDSSYFLNTELEEISFSTSDELILKSWVKKPESEDEFTILIFHGNGGHVGHRVSKFETFIEKGYGLFFLEYRGYADNPGKPSEKGLYNDALAAIQFLSEKNLLDNDLKFRSMVLPDRFIDHDNQDLMYKYAGLDSQDIETKILDSLNTKIIIKKTN